MDRLVDRGLQPRRAAAGLAAGKRASGAAGQGVGPPGREAPAIQLLPRVGHEHSHLTYMPEAVFHLPPPPPFPPDPSPPTPPPSCRPLQVLKALAADGIAVRMATRKLAAEEAPQSYKDVSEVVDTCHAAGISRKVARLRPIIVVKG